MSRMYIDKLKLNVRTRNLLIRYKIETVQDLIKMTRSSLLSIKGLGIKSVNEIERALFMIDLHLASEHSQ